MKTKEKIIKMIHICVHLIHSFSKHKHDMVYSYLYLESLNGSVVGIQDQTGERAGLGRPVPAIRAVNQYTVAALNSLLIKQ